VVAGLILHAKGEREEEGKDGKVGEGKKRMERGRNGAKERKKKGEWVEVRKHSRGEVQIK
jgi:hypothetical protein